MNLNPINPIFNGSLDEAQSDGLNAIVAGCTKFEVTDNRMIAYILATAFWETGRTMQPIEEFGKGAGHTYGEMIKENGDPYTTPDEIYYGRGYCQTTWYENYEMLSEQEYAISKGWDFLNHPELLLEGDPSVWAMIHCMWHGSFTGVGLSKYFNDTVTDPVNARRIINGTDHAEEIAEDYDLFYQALTT